MPRDDRNVALGPAGAEGGLKVNAIAVVAGSREPRDRIATAGDAGAPRPARPFAWKPEAAAAARARRSRHSTRLVPEARCTTLAEGLLSVLVAI